MPWKMEENGTGIGDLHRENDDVFEFGSCCFTREHSILPLVEYLGAMGPSAASSMHFDLVSDALGRSERLQIRNHRDLTRQQWEYTISNHDGNILDLPEGALEDSECFGRFDVPRLTFRKGKVPSQLHM